MLKTWRSRTIFWSWALEKWHAAVARSTFASQNAQNTPCSDHFLKLGCGKIARRCSEKHIFKSKCTKHTMLGPLFEVGMWKNGTLLQREAHLQVKMLKNWRSRTTFWSSAVQKWHAAVARSTFAIQNVKNMTCSGHVWVFRSRKMARRCGAKHIYKSECKKHLRFAPLLEVPMSQGRKTEEKGRKEDR